MVDKIPHLVVSCALCAFASALRQLLSLSRRSQALGITAVELLPPFEFDELEFQRIPSPRNHMVRPRCQTPAGFVSRSQPFPCR